MTETVSSEPLDDSPTGCPVNTDTQAVRSETSPGGAAARTLQHPTLPSPQVVLARVASVIQEAILVDIAGQSYAARQAASCLLSPEVGDTVMCSLSQLGVHILHVLERDAGDSATLSAPGVQRLVLDQAAIDIRTQDLNATAARAQAHIDRFHLFSRLVSVVVGGLELVADRLKRVAGHEITSVTDSVRTVQNTDILRAGHILHEASEVMSVRSHMTVIEARGDVRVNGERISMG